MSDLRDELLTQPPQPVSPPTLRYKLTLAYDGSGFHGWQKQHPPGQQPLRTVQQVVEDALVRLLRQPVKLIGASRTDAGVHAKGQVAHFDAATPIPVERMAMALRGRLPDDVDVIDLAFAPPGFDAISGARSKQYRYRIWNAVEKPLGYRHMLYHGFVTLDVDRMNHAAARLIGEHDFEGFACAKHGRESTVRTITRCEVIREDAPGSTPGSDPESHPGSAPGSRPGSDPTPGGDKIVTIIVEGNGFLYNMVRIIAGTLFEVGRGHFEPSRVDEVLRTTDRQLAGPTLPPEGLCLEWIRYADA